MWLKALTLFVFQLAIFTSVSASAQYRSEEEQNSILVRLLNSGQEAAQARIDLIQNAKVSIEAQYYIYADDKTSYISLALLRQAARRGVKVRLIVDALFNGVPRALRQYLQAEGIELREYHPLSIFRPSQLARRMHDKVMIIDGEHMITGGRNIKDDYYDVPVNGRKYRDRDVYVKGAGIINKATQDFNKKWNDTEHVRPMRFGIYTRLNMTNKCDGANFRLNEACAKRKERALKKYHNQLKQLDQTLNYLNSQNVFTENSGRDWSEGGFIVKNARFVSDPAGKKSKEPGVAQELLGLINRAEKLIVIESPYVNPSKEMVKAFEDARRRNVEIHILTNSSYSGDNTPSLISYYKSEKQQMLNLGIKIWEYKGPDSLHAKSMVVDGLHTFVGSFNLDRLSFSRNTETGIIAEDSEFAAAVSEDINDRMLGSWEMGSDGNPIDGAIPESGYPWKKGTNGIKTKVLRFLLPLYREIL